MTFFSVKKRLLSIPQPRILTKRLKTPACGQKIVDFDVKIDTNFAFLRI